MYHRTVIQVEVLSQEPLGDMCLAGIADQMARGNFSGRVRTVSAVEVNGPAMANLLIGQGSDPEFFGLDEHGQEVEH